MRQSAPDDFPSTSLDQVIRLEQDVGEHGADEDHGQDEDAARGAAEPLVVVVRVAPPVRLLPMHMVIVGEDKP